MVRDHHVRYTESNLVEPTQSPLGVWGPYFAASCLELASVHLSPSPVGAPLLFYFIFIFGSAPHHIQRLNMVSSFPKYRLKKSHMR